MIKTPNPHVLVLLPEQDLAIWNHDLELRGCKLSQTGSTFELGKFEHIPEKLACSTDGTLIAFGLSNREIRLWDTASRRLRPEILSQPDQIVAMTLTPANRSLVTVSVNAVMRCWNLNTGQLTLEQRLLPEIDKPGLYSVSFSPDMRFLALRPADGTIHVFRWF